MVSPSLGGKLLHHRPGLLPHIERTDDGQAHLDQCRARDVGAGDRLLLDEAVVGEHRQKPMRRRVGDAEIFAGVGEPHPWLLTKQQKQQQRVVHRGYGIGRASIALRSCLLHRRSLPAIFRLGFADSPRPASCSKVTLDTSGAAPRFPHSRKLSILKTSPLKRSAWIKTYNRAPRGLGRQAGSDEPHEGRSETHLRAARGRDDNAGRNPVRRRR